MSASQPVTRASVWEWLQVALLMVNLGWTTLCLGGFRAETLVVTSLLTALLVVVHFGGRALGADARVDLARGQTQSEIDVAANVISASRIYRRVHPASWWLFPFLVYAIYNAGWLSPVRWLAWDDVLRWTQLVAIFWVVLNGLRGTKVRAVLLGSLLTLGGIAAAMAVYQRVVDHEWMMLGRRQAVQFLGRASGPFGNPNSLAALLILLLPVTVALPFRRGLSDAARIGLGGLALLLAAGLVMTVSRGAWIGLAVAFTVWPLLVPGKHWGWRVGAALSVLTLLVATVATLYATVPTVRYRLDRLVEDAGEKSRPVMWRAAWKLFREHPAIGTGAGSYPELFEKYRPEYFPAEPHWAHNDYLNTLSDYGLIGFGLLTTGALVIIGIASRAAIRAGSERREEISVALALAIGVLAFSLHLFVDFHLKMPALAMVFATVAAVTVQQFRPMRTRREVRSMAPRILSALVAMTVLAGMAGMVLPHYRSEAWRDDQRREIDQSAREDFSAEEQKKVFSAALAAFTLATEIDSANSQAWADRALATELAAKFSPEQTKLLGVEAERAARRALSGSVVIAEFWLRLGVALDMQGRWSEAGEALVKALRLAPAKSESWFHHAYHISLHLELHEMREIAMSEVAISLRLDPRNREAEALRERLRAKP